MNETKGVIYILTNPPFKEFVKIGYADDVERRLKELNRSECVPFAFRVYATYEVDTRLSDKKVHAIIDKLNPGLRSIEDFNGQTRVREFYAMSAEDAYSILEAMAEIHNCTGKLKRYTQNEIEQRDEQMAKEIQLETRTRAENFTFSEAQIPIGAVLEYKKDASITCKVVDDRRVDYQGEIMYLTGVVKKITGTTSAVAGPRYFKYKGADLWNINGRVE